MGFKEEIEKARKEKLGLDKVDTKKVFDSIMSVYKEKVIDAPRNIMGYTIDLVICNMNKYNKLGNKEYLYSEWGDNFYVDLNNSSFFEVEIDEDGDINHDNENELYFKDRSELKEIENISFSLKELISYCEKNNFKVRLCDNSPSNSPTTIEIEPYEPYNQNEKSINCYLKSIK